VATPFPITLPASSVLGRRPLPAAGEAEAIPYATLASDFGIPFLNSPITKRKTADQSLTTQTALQNDSDLSFAIAASEEWIVVFHISAAAANATTGFKIGVAVPSGATVLSSLLYGGDGTAQGANYAAVTASGQIISATPNGNNNGILVRVWVLNGTTPGNVTLQFAQVNSSGTALTFLKGSFMQATRAA